MIVAMDCVQKLLSRPYCMDRRNDETDWHSQNQSVKQHDNWPIGV